MGSHPPTSKPTIQTTNLIREKLSSSLHEACPFQTHTGPIILSVAMLSKDHLGSGTL